IEPRRGATAVWTGRELVVLGGDTCLDAGAGNCPVDAELQRGAAYDPRTGAWRRIAPAPALLTGAGTVVRVGETVVVVDPQAQGGTLSYDPDTDTWRTLSAGSPSSAGYPTAFRNDVVTFALGPGDVIRAERVDLASGRSTPFGSAPL